MRGKKTNKKKPNSTWEKAFRWADGTRKKKKKKHRGVIGDSVEREEHDDDDDDAKWHGLQENEPFPESIINITNENGVNFKVKIQQSE